MNEADFNLVPARRCFQWRLSTWFVLVAILGWAFAISPPQIVVTDALQLPNGQQSVVGTTKYLNPHYFAPLFALTAFACWKEASNQRGFGRPALRRRVRRIAFKLSLLATAVAIGALCAHVYYDSAANIPEASGPQFWARMMAANWSLAFYCSAGIAIGLVVGLMHSKSEVVEPNAGPACTRS